MLSDLRKLRDQYGGVFVTQLPSGRSIPWKPISIGEYIRYDLDVKRGLITQAQIEDEIFKKCVLDESVIREMPFLKAGDVSTVTYNIWQYSGPSGVEEFNHDLDIARSMLANPGTAVIHELVQLILLAFNYKPEEVYAMDYETFMTRVVQAETKLLQSGMMKKPIKLEVQGEKKSRIPFSNLNDEPPRSSVDLKELWKQQQLLIQVK